MNKIRSNHGFTLAETLVGSTIFIMLTGSLMLFTHSMSHMQYEFQTRLALANRSQTTLTKMLWGTMNGGTREAMWEAESFNIVAPNILQYTDSNNIVHEIRQVGLKILKQDNGGAWQTIYDPDGPGDAESAAVYSTSLIFTQDPQPSVVQVQLILGEKSAGRWNHVSTTTHVAFRNG